MITIHSANDDKFDYKIQVNDQPYYQYHKNNGITKLGFLNGNETKWVTRPTDGALDLSNRLNQAYINKLFPETYIVSGTQFMPFKPDLRKEAQKLVCGAAYVVLPVLQSLSTPVFLYNIVLEKEFRLIENMKINGLQMGNYYKVNTVYNFAMFLITWTSNILFGRYVMNLLIYTDTKVLIMMLASFGWGLCQISFAFLF